MVNQNSIFGGMLTNAGAAKKTNCDALGIPWQPSFMLIGDANGADPVPSPEQTKLINQVYRAPLNQLYVSPTDANVLVAELVLPPNVGGWWIRELALEDVDGVFSAVANCAPSYKPLLVQGSGRNQVVRMHIVTSNTANIQLKIDPAVVLATREYVDTSIIAALNKQDFKHSVQVATTAPIALSGPQTVDGVALSAGARVLVKDQAVGKDNGIYLVAAGAWARTADADASVEVTPGLFVHVEQGVVGADSVWQLVTDAPITLGITPLAFEMLVGRTGVSAGTYTKLTVDKNGRVIAGTSPTTLAGFGITDTYTKAEIESIVARSASLPVGAIVAFPRGTVPAGFLEVDGSVQSIAAYPDLAAYLGTAFNTGGEGAGNFRLPESRGEFLRGWDHGRGVDAGRALGSYQIDQFQGHRHGPLGTSTAYVTYGSGAGGAANSAGMIDRATTGDPVTDGVNGSPRTGNETRPRNLAVMWCLKAWSAPINQGNIDIAALVSELDALKAAVPVGSIVPFPKAAVQPGYLELDGSAYSIAAYPALAAYLGTTYNNGTEPAGYFRLPDARGEFLRGWDHGRGVDAGRVIGSWQKGSLEAIDINIPGAQGVASNIADPDASRVRLGYDSGDMTLYAGSQLTGANAASSFPVPGAAEVTYGISRPRNLAVMWCIKAWNAPVNQGSIDIAALAASIANLPLLGFGQTWQNVTASRVPGTTYTNTTGRPIVVSCYANSASTNNINLTVSGVVVAQNIVNNATSGANSTVSAIVPHGATYSVATTPSPISLWSELR
ncbi:phage tail protein [Pseudomonas gingeri]|uniref:phage tail protein n=1 Tax=Pseudomonas gingeri TaxID=117681 RepID=UPI0015A101D7|nr:phage tail protein [Pseudomonas gingeri]NWD04101.1 phage tail protein [Pseudomonas gingeri]NWE33899.1 phage tail protein [Pseudomonas gingeri]NWE58015.1 phage tail protein [Pseudomonas gingeri]NWF04374.1 phage tail protein [Pseudomonas gingeri]